MYSEGQQHQDVNVKMGTAIIATYGVAWTIIGRFWLGDPGIATIGAVAGLIPLFVLSSFIDHRADNSKGAE